MVEREEVLERFRAGNRGLQISSDTRNQHISEMQELLASFERANEPTPSSPSRLVAGLRNSAILVAAFVLGMAAAASSELVPGDLLYPAKRVAEQPVQIVDHDIVASNRVGELEELILREADPELVLMARTDAVGAVLAIQPDEDLARALSLLAWPGGLIGYGVTAGPSPAGLVISNAEWDNPTGYSASLADGHLVTVSSIGEEMLIGTTGNWTVVTVGGGWRLTSEDVDQRYFIERSGDDLVVSLEQPDQPSQTTGSAEENAAERSTGQSTDWTPSLKAGTGGFRNDDASEPTEDVTGGAAIEPRNGPTPTSGQVVDDDPVTTSEPSEAQAPAPTQTTTSVPATQQTNPTETTVASPGTSQQTAPPPSATVPPASTTTSPPVTVPQTTAQPTTVTTSPPPEPSTTTTTAPVPIERVVYLRNGGGGNTSSSRSLDMSAGSAPGGSLGNYDTDRDDAAGLLLAKDGAGLGTSDRTKFQEWVWTVDSTMTLSGNADLTIWLAAKDFKTDERIGLLASLDVCSPGCTRLGTGQWSGPGSGGFSRATIGLGSFDLDVQAGATLRLKVVVPDGLATTDVWLAYDAGSYPSRLTIG